MRKKTISHWKKVDELSDLLFLVQRLDEMLFDYTIDTYKPLVLNTVLLCNEASRALELINEGVIDKNHLKHIVEELNWNYSNDITAKEILSKYDDLYLPILDYENTEDLKVKLELVLLKLSPKIYIPKCKELLFESVKKGEKRHISSLSSYLITSLKAIGYSQAFLYHTIQNYFYNWDNPIHSVTQLKSFLDIFPLVKKKYQVLFIVSNIFNEIKDSCEAFKLKIIDTIPENFNQPSITFTTNANETYLLCEEVFAPDFVKARLSAESIISKISNLFVFFHHKSKPSYRSDTLVIDMSSNELVICPEPNSPMVKGFDHKPKKAAIKLNHLLKNFGLEEDSFLKIDRAIDMHSIALDNKSLSNQILNLWIGFETIIPNNEKHSKLSQIIHCIMPSLKVQYLNTLIKNLAKDLTYWNSIKVHSYLKSIDIGKNATEKITALLLCEEYEELRNKLFAEIHNYPLLINRIFEFNKALCTGKKILSFIQNHEKKVTWQIRRIYRTRNLIVHSGQAQLNLDLLVENTHTYLDHFINQLIDLSTNNHIATIEQGIKESELLWKKQERILNTLGDNKLNKENIFNVISL